MSKCITLFSIHEYKARYDEVEIPGALDKLTGRSYASDIPHIDRALYIRKVYVQDVCVHCGDVIDRLEPPSK